MALFKISKGRSENLPTNKVDGYCYVTTNDHKFYVDYTKDDGTLDRFALNAVTADIAQKLGTTNIGNPGKPIYLEEGTPRECVDFLPLSAGESKKIMGPLGLTENVNYGTSLPDEGFVGQIFFLENGKADNGPSLPTGGTAGQVLTKNSSVDGDASWTTDIAGNAATATKAIQDGNGNIISSTYLPLNAGENSKLIGPLGLTENINYGTSLPDNGFDGQLFFLEDENIDGPSLPTGGTTGQVLVKNSSTDGDANWATDISGNAGTASKLVSAKTVCTNLASNLAESFDGTANITPGVTGILGISNGGTGATTASRARANIGAVNMVTKTVILSASNWSNNTQVVNVSGVTSDNTILVSYDPESYEAYSDAAIRCVSQGNDTLTFTCESIPSVDVSANVVILN